MLTARNTERTADTPATQPESRQAAVPAAPSADEVLDLVRRDSLDQPKKYLDEVHVPGGGE